MLKSHQKLCRHRGAATVEFALVAPLLFLFVLGLIEFARMEMVEQKLVSATQEACRAGVVPGSTSSDVQARATESLSGGLVPGATVSITPAEVATLKAGQPITVRVQVPAQQISWLPSPNFLKNRMLKAECTMLREAK